MSAESGWGCSLECRIIGVGGQDGNKTGVIGVAGISSANLVSELLYTLKKKKKKKMYVYIY